MGKGVLYKSDGSAWSKSVAMTGNGSSMANTIVKHSDGTTWYDNFPMEQQYSQAFNPTWSQGYNASGVSLDPATWGDKLWSGGATMDGRSLIGYDRTAINNFVANGQVLEVKVLVNLESYDHNGNAIVDFFPHVYTSKPSNFSLANANQNYKTEKTFTKGAWGGYWINLPTTAISSMGSSMAGIAFKAPQATSINSCTFTGKSGFNSQLIITVLK